MIAGLSGIGYFYISQIPNVRFHVKFDFDVIVIPQYFVIGRKKLIGNSIGLFADKVN